MLRLQELDRRGDIVPRTPAEIMGFARRVSVGAKADRKHG